MHRHPHHFKLLDRANRVLRALMRAGVPINILGNPVYLLTVRGRKSGHPRMFAVDPYEYNDRRFFFAR